MLDHWEPRAGSAKPTCLGLGCMRLGAMSVFVATLSLQSWLSGSSW